MKSTKMAALRNRAKFEKEILAAVDVYHRTGEIPEILVPFFEQNGRWIGDRRNMTSPTYKISQALMKEATLPVARRTNTSNRGKLILLTSFYRKTNHPLTIPWNEVRGGIKLKGDARFSAPHLRVVGHDIYASSNLKIDLPRLRCVGGDLDCPHTWRVHAPRLCAVGKSVQVTEVDLPALESVGNRLSMRWTDHILVPRLQTVGGAFHVHCATSLHAPVIETVGGALIATHAHTFRAPNLHTVCCSLLLGRATQIAAPELRFVRCVLDTVVAADFYNPEIQVGGTWIAHPQAATRWRARKLLTSRPLIDL